MMAVHQRIAELWVKSKQGLNVEEQTEMVHCMEANVSYAYKLAGLENLSYLAFESEDWDWLHDICAQIETLEYTTKKPKAI